MNTELAKLVYKQVTEFPESFDMRNYIYQAPCGTAGCLAGHTLLLSGYSFTSTRRHDGSYACSLTRPDGVNISDPSKEAMDLLEISPEDYLGEDDKPLFFDYEHALDRFRQMIERHELDFRRE